MLGRAALEVGHRRAPLRCWLPPPLLTRGLHTNHDVDTLVKELKARQLPVRVDVGNLTNAKLLDATFDCLNVLSGPPSRSGKEKLTAGRHLVYFPPVTKSSDLLEDGTDMIHAPDRSYKYRLWAGGSVRQQNTSDLRSDRRYALVEKIGDVKVRGEKVFVQIRRAVVLDGSLIDLRHFTGGEKASSKVIARVFGPEGLDRTVLDGQGNKQRQVIKEILVEEMRWLCFMRDKPPPPQSAPESQSPRPPPNNAFHEITITTTPAMLFRFSALTFNAHAIHIDPEYTKNVYGLPDLLVHGPMTLYMLIYSARVVAQKASAQSKNSASATRSSFRFHSIDYKNLAPIFVREAITIGSTEPVPVAVPETDKDSGVDGRQGEGEQAMVSTMWISKRMPDGRSTVCVSATVRFWRRAANFKKVVLA